MSPQRTWPLAAKVIIFLGCIGNLRNLFAFMMREDLFAGVVGVTGLVIWWYIYKFKLWGLLALNVLVLISIFMMIIKLMSGAATLLNGFIGIGIQLGLLIYFDNKALDGIFDL